MAGRKRPAQDGPAAQPAADPSAQQRFSRPFGKPARSWKPPGKRQRTPRFPVELQPGLQQPFAPFPAVPKPPAPGHGLGVSSYAVLPTTAPQVPLGSPPAPRPRPPRAPHNSNGFLLNHKRRKIGRRTPRERRTPAAVPLTPACSTPASIHARSTPRRQAFSSLVAGTNIDEFGSAGGLLQPTDTDSEDEYPADSPRRPFQTQAAKIKDLEIENASLRTEVESLRSRLAQLENSNTMESSPATSTALTAIEVDKSS